MELWKTIPTFETYEASNLGRVRNKKTGKVLRPNKNSKGYRHVLLYRNCKDDRHTVGVHRAVAMAWLPCTDFTLTVNHKDENPNNNALENLEWMDSASNIKYSQGKKVKCVETGVVYQSIWDASRDTKLCCRTIRDSLKNMYEKKKRSKLSFVYV